MNRRRESFIENTTALLLDRRKLILVSLLLVALNFVSFLLYSDGNPWTYLVLVLTLYRDSCFSKLLTVLFDN